MRAPRIAVIGAGIAGLTAALALARSGLRCLVFERAGRFPVTGAGIQLTPNATQLLARLGVGETLDRIALRPVAMEFRGWRDDELIGRTELGGACERRYGAPYYTAHRADLHRVLLRRIGPGVVRRGWRCVGVREGGADVVVAFAGGMDAAVDLVVGADGVHSAVRRALGLAPPRYSGLAAYRALVDAGRLSALPAEPDVVIWLGPGQHAVRYPVSRQGWVNVVATAPVPQWDSPSWTVPAQPADLRIAYRDWHPHVRSVLGSADRVTRWALLTAPLGPRLHGARIALVGDAAQTMLPFGAQGANQAIEDAVALAACLEGTDAAGVPDALTRYGRVRLLRRARVGAAIEDNARSHHLAEVTAQRRRDREIAAGRHLRSRDWLYGYDAEQAIRGGASRYG